MRTRLSPKQVAAAFAAVLSEVSERDRPAAIAACARFLARKRLLHAADAVLDALDEALLAREGNARAEVAAATEVPPADVHAIEMALVRAVGSPVRARVRVRPALLAGFRADVRGLRVDASLQGVLARLRARVGRSNLGFSILDSRHA